MKTTTCIIIFIALLNYNVYGNSKIIINHNDIYRLSLSNDWEHLPADQLQIISNSILKHMKLENINVQHYLINRSLKYQPLVIIANSEIGEQPEYIFKDNSVDTSEFNKLFNNANINFSNVKKSYNSLNKCVYYLQKINSPEETKIYFSALFITNYGFVLVGFLDDERDFYNNVNQYLLILDTFKLNDKFKYSPFDRPSNIPLSSYWEKGTWIYIDNNSISYIWNKQGRKVFQCELKNKRCNGKYILWNDNGDIEEGESFYDSGIKYSLIKKADGSPIKASFLKNNNEIWLHDYTKSSTNEKLKGLPWHKQLGGWVLIKNNQHIILYETGDIKYEYSMHGYDYHGSFKTRYRGGRVSIIGQYNFSKKNGTWTLYNYDGSIYGIFKYNNGVEIEKIYMNSKRDSIK